MSQFGLVWYAAGKMSAAFAVAICVRLRVRAFASTPDCFSCVCSEGAAAAGAPPQRARSSLLDLREDHAKTGRNPRFDV